MMMQPDFVLNDAHAAKKYQVSRERLLCRSERVMIGGLQQPQGCLKGDIVPLNRSLEGE